MVICTYFQQGRCRYGSKSSRPYNQPPTNIAKQIAKMNIQAGRAWVIQAATGTALCQDPHNRDQQRGTGLEVCITSSVHLVQLLMNTRSGPVRETSTVRVSSRDYPARPQTNDVQLLSQPRSNRLRSNSRPSTLAHFGVRTWSRCPPSVNRRTC